MFILAVIISFKAYESLIIIPESYNLWRPLRRFELAKTIIIDEVANLPFVVQKFLCKKTSEITATVLTI